MCIQKLYFVVCGEYLNYVLRGHKKLGEHDYAHKHNFYAQIFLLNVILY